MDQKKRPGLKGLLAKSRGGSSKEAPKTQPPPEILVPHPPIRILSLSRNNQLFGMDSRYINGVGLGIEYVN